MLEESLDPRPSFEAALAALLEPLGQDESPRARQMLCDLWDGRQPHWSNLRTVQHWLERAR